MNIKKQLRKLVGESEKRILEKDAEFIDEFKAAYCREQKNESKKKNIVIPLSAAFACAVCAVLLILFLPNVGIFGFKSEKKYLEENRITVESNIEELNTNLDDIKFNVLQDYSCSVKRIYDSKYNETLFFKLDVYNDSDTVNIEIYVNKSYTDKKFIESENSEKVNGLEYYIVKEKISGTKAQFTYGDVSVYMEYQSLKANSGDDGFISFLERAFTVS